MNVAGLDDNMFSDTLFGHTRGAFTGADRPRDGMIATAAEGTLFLEESYLRNDHRAMQDLYARPGVSR